MNPQTMIVVCFVLVPMIVSSALSELPKKSPGDEIPNAHKRAQSVFEMEFTIWADKQDWFALSKTAKFGDLDRDRCAEKGRAFGYSVEFVDSKGAKHILGVGLAKEPKSENQMGMKRNMAEMCAKKSLAMHGQPVSTNATGSLCRSVDGIILRGMTVLSKTIVRPETEEKWILCVCTGKRQTDNVPSNNEQPKERKLGTPPSCGAKAHDGND